jgi:uncharacterized protein
MKVQQKVDIPAPIDEVWTVLLDVPRVATCMPGAILTQVVDADTFDGTVSVRVGPIGVHYQGRLVVEQRDATNYSVRMRAAGTDRKGSGAAKAIIAASLAEPSPGWTRLQVDSTVDLRGRIATLGRGIQDVADKVLGEFADRLSNEMRTTAAAGRTAVSAAMAAPLAAGSASTQPAPALTVAGRDDGSVEALPEPPGTAPTAAAYSRTPPIKVGALLWSILRDKLKQLFRRESGKR